MAAHTAASNSYSENPERVLDVLRSLEETGACAKPRGDWEPGLIRKNEI
jgi:hypothetical protein